jgi:uncharacterized membrane protein YgcG
MTMKLRKVGFVASAYAVATAGCTFLAHDPLSPPHVRKVACATGHIGTALEQKLSPEYQEWCDNVKHFWGDTCQEFSDEYHRNNDWPQPYSRLAEHSVRDPLDMQAENARMHLATLWDFHFDSGTAQLNSMGQKRLQNIVGQGGAMGQVIYVQRTPSTTETELRLDQVRRELTQLDLGGVAYDVAEARTTPTIMVGEEAKRAMKIITNPSKPQGKNSSYGSGSGDFSSGGGSSEGNQ